LGTFEAVGEMIEARIGKQFPAGRDSVGFALDIELSARTGVTALFGPSGAGKTLTLDCIAGFMRPESGRILIDDALVFDGATGVHLRPQDRRCGYVFQNYALFPHMTLRENLSFAAAASRGGTERHRKVNEMLERFRLVDVAGRKPHEVSGGQKQRCSIARALIGSPRVLLLDEPARGLDAPLRTELYGILRQVRSEFGTPIVLVTHSLDECLELADEMVIVEDGSVVQSGRPADISGHPKSLELARLLGIFNLVPVEIRTLDPSRKRSVVRWGEYEIEGDYYPGHLKGDRVHLLITPRQLFAMPRVARPGPNQVPVQLQRVVETADSLRLEFAEGVQAEIPRGPVDRNNGDWLVEFPTRGLRVL
jgi:molybdate transport system ATP-binding protein